MLRLRGIIVAPAEEAKTGGVQFHQAQARLFAHRDWLAVYNYFYSCGVAGV